MMIDIGIMRSERHVVNTFLAQRTEASALQQLAYLVEANLLFKVLRINHSGNKDSVFLPICVLLSKKCSNLARH